jgi:hypothetical protein
MCLEKNRRATSGILGALAAIAWLVPSTAFAESAAELIQRGKDQVQAGQIDAGCETLSQAEAMEPNVDSIGLVAACHEKQGRTATAYREYLETATRAANAHDEREGYARDQAARLSPSVARLTIHVFAGDKLDVTLSAKPIDSAALAAPILVDPGAIQIAATEPGGKKWSTNVQIQSSDQRVVDVPSIATWEPKRSAATSTSPLKPERRVAKGPPPSAIALGVVGLAGLGVMAGGGIAAIVLNRDSENINTRSGCNHIATPGPCQHARDERNQAAAASVAADVGLGVGVAGLATAAFLWGFHVGAKELPPDDSKGASLRFVDIEPISGGAVVGFGFVN